MCVSAQVTICIHSLHIVGTVYLHVGDVLILGFRVFVSVFIHRMLHVRMLLRLSEGVP